MTAGGSPLQAQWLRTQTFGFFATWCIFLTYWGLWLTNGKHIGTTAAGIAIAIGFICRGAGALVLAPVVITRFGAYRCYLWSSTTAALAACGYLCPLSNWVLFGLTALVGMTYTPLMSILETMLVTADASYGRVRAFGSVGFIIATAITGIVMSVLGVGAIVYLFIGILSATAICAWVRRPNLALHATKPLARSKFHVIVRELRSIPGYGGVLGSCVAIQASHGACYGYAAVRLAAAHVSDVGISLCLLTAVGAEIGGFRLGNRIVARRDPMSLLAFCAVAATLRWSLLAASTAVAVFLASQLLHALSFALTHSVHAHFLQDRLPAATIPAAQGLYVAFGLSWATGALTALAGSLYGRDGRDSFAAMAVIAGATAVYAKIARSRVV